MPLPPATRREPLVELLHGQRVADPYRWLEAPDEEVLSWLEAQNRHARARLDALPTRPEVQARLAELSYLDSVSPPVKRGGRYFYERRHKDREKAVVVVREPGGQERTLLDPSALSKDGSCSVRRWFPSWDGRKLAYTLNLNNADEATLHLRDVDTGHDSLVDVIPGARYAGPAWVPDSSGYYYEFLPEDSKDDIAARPGRTQLRYHLLGQDPSQDRLVFPATRDPKTFLSGSISRDGRWLYTYVQYGWNRNSVYVRDARLPLPAVSPALIAPSPQLSTEERVDRAARQLGYLRLFVGKDALFYPTWHDGHFYALTNDGAPNYRVVRASGAQLQAPGRELPALEVVVPEQTESLESFAIVGGQLVLSYLDQAASAVRVHELSGQLRSRVELPSMGSVGTVHGNPSDDEAFFSFSSFSVPPEIRKLSVASGQQELWARVNAPVDTAAFEVEQQWLTSRDGTRLSMFVVRRKGQARDGKAPTLLYGYGGFNVALTPHFSALATTWVENGGVYAVANLRGGGEYGESWHRAGMLANKQNVFDDFAAAAEHLVSAGYTDARHLGIYGGSNGGLLVGAAMTQRPELFGAVVCAVPLLDMVRYHLFGSGRTWIEEYGSAEDSEQFRALYDYSPYHHVPAGGGLPPLLMMAADSDDRVDPMHARKFVAAVQAAAEPGTPVLLRVEQNAGHGGGDMVEKRVASSADIVSFLLDQLQ